MKRIISIVFALLMLFTVGCEKGNIDEKRSSVEYEEATLLNCGCGCNATVEIKVISVSVTEKSVGVSCNVYNETKHKTLNIFYRVYNEDKNEVYDGGFMCNVEFGENVDKEFDIHGLEYYNQAYSLEFYEVRYS